MFFEWCNAFFKIDVEDMEGAVRPADAALRGTSVQLPLVRHPYDSHRRVDTHAIVPIFPR